MKSSIVKMSDGQFKELTVGKCDVQRVCCPERTSSE
jgi:hypothetical protein